MSTQEKILSLTEPALYKLIDTVLEEMKEKFGVSDHPEFIGEAEAMKLLGIRSKSSLQALRDNDSIVFTQPRRKIILYQRSSILEYLHAHKNR